jgi:hypothetical protein
VAVETASPQSSFGQINSGSGWLVTLSAGRSVTAGSESSGIDRGSGVTDVSAEFTDVCDESTGASDEFTGTSDEFTDIFDESTGASDASDGSH